MSSRADSQLADGQETPDSLADSSHSSSPTTSPVSSSEELAHPAVPAASQANSNPGPSQKTNSPLTQLNADRRPPIGQPTMSRTGSGLPQDIAARMEAMRLSRQNSPAPPRPGAGAGIPASSRLGPGGVPANFRMPQGAGRPPISHNISPVPSRSPGGLPTLSQQRGIIAGVVPGRGPTASAPPGKKRPGLTLSQMNSSSTIGSATGSDSGGASQPKPEKSETLLEKYAEYLDPKTGNLIFKGKATLTNHGVDFAGGKSFSISLDEVDTLDELGKGNYGTVYKVRHSRPVIRRPGLGLAGNKAYPSHSSSSGSETLSPVESYELSPTSINTAGRTSGVVMAMKEIRLELDDAKFRAIIMELDILHRCVSPYIVDFYGAFFQEGAVYICLEFMDGGSIDKLYYDGIPEEVLRRITASTTLGLKWLKEEYDIIHRDVKPTNILANTRGQVKICDFGVSGNLVASIAKTNIGCQSYMAPERISSGGMAQAGAGPGAGTYSVQSDIWSLGLTIIECALGRYPYPPETYDNIFSQLSAIVDGDPPDLPAERFSEAAHDFVSGCLMKIPNLRPTYPMLLQHPWLAPLVKPPTISEEDEDAVADEAPPSTDTGGASPTSNAPAVVDEVVSKWVIQALENRRARRANPTAANQKTPKPALHAAPLDVVGSPSLERLSVESDEAGAREVESR